MESFIRWVYIFKQNRLANVQYTQIDECPRKTDHTEFDETDLEYEAEEGEMLNMANQVHRHSFNLAQRRPSETKTKGFTGQAETLRYLIIITD